MNKTAGQHRPERAARGRIRSSIGSRPQPGRGGTATLLDPVILKHVVISQRQRHGTAAFRILNARYFNIGIVRMLLRLLRHRNAPAFLGRLLLDRSIFLCPFVPVNRGQRLMNSINAVEDGRAITDQTVEAFGNVVDNIKQADQNIAEIANMVHQNVDIVSDAVRQIERISSVVDENVRISQDTKQVSSNMADITGKLLEIVE